MGEIVLVDTSVFLNVLNVPGFNQQRTNLLLQFERLLDRNDVTFLLPFAAILETGNHIAHLSDGRQRRRFASDFADMVQQALDGTAPWTPTPAVDLSVLSMWLRQYPDHAMREVGLGDLMILKEWEATRARHPGHRVRIWSIDAHLAARDHDPGRTTRTP